jgi:23S rRNA (adenine2503-C2)-methyltransferase
VKSTAQPFLQLSFEDFQTWLLDHKIPKFRGDQVFQWVYKKGCLDFSKMSNLSKDLQTKLAEYFSFPEFNIEEFVSDDGVRKFHVHLKDGKSIESVWIPEINRATLCVSSQVGCAMACKFCVTGLQGFTKNLTVEEILMQMYYVRWVRGLNVSNVVFMGMGEPMLNFDNVVKSVNMLTSVKAYELGLRKVSVSTVGMVPKILPFMESTNVRLAISLTGSTNETRDHWMPINQKHNLQELKKVLKQLPDNKWRKIMDQTDTDDQAKSLIKFLEGLSAKVNLIPYNENPRFPDLKAPNREQLLKYRDRLMKAGFHTTIRKNRGNGIFGACGQLSSSKYGTQIENLPVTN